MTTNKGVPIIAEGCDCVGKTTFAEMLAKKTGYEIIKGSSFEISELGSDGMFEYMMKLLDRKGVIIDRFFYSNLVYGKLYNYPMMTPEQYRLLADKLNKNALVLYLHAPADVIKQRMNNRGDDMIKQEEVDSILGEYREVMHGDFRPKTMLSLDTSDSNFTFATTMVADMLDLEMTKIYVRN